MLGTLQKLLGNDQDYSFLFSSEPALFFSFGSSISLSKFSRAREKEGLVSGIHLPSCPTRRGLEKVYSITLMYRSNMSFNLHPQNHVFATLELFKPDI
jgi:hypothetical protein